MYDDDDIEIIEDSDEHNLKCFKYNERLYANLCVEYNKSNSVYILWNKYQIFVHENREFVASNSITLSPEFQIRQVIPTSSYLFCLDCTGTIHVTSLKFKNSSQKRFKSCFLPREQSILRSTRYSTNYILSLKVYSQCYFLCINKVDSEFQLEKKVILTSSEEWPLHNSDEKVLFHSYEVKKEEFNTDLQKLFKNELSLKDSQIVLICFDSFTIYGCSISHKDSSESAELIKLFTSPSEICDFTILKKGNLKLLIGLSSGTLLEMTLENIDDNPNLVHLNTSLSIFSMTSTDSLIYTDGVTMWRSTNLFSAENLTFRQFIVKDVKDFIESEGVVICTTFSNMIYIFNITNDTSYIKGNEDVYYPVEKLLNNCTYLININDEIEKNKKIIDKIDTEESYLLALSLSKRQDLMEEIIHHKVVVYENYVEVVKENAEIKLTDELDEYFKPDTQFFLIQLSATSINNIINNLLRNLKIHISLVLNGIYVKTATINLEETLKKVEVLMPLQGKEMSRLIIEIKLMYQIPDVMDKKQVTWTCLYKNCIKLEAENFIKTHCSYTNVVNLKTQEENLEKLILETAQNQHGELFDIIDTAQLDVNKTLMKFYLKIPNNFKEILNGLSNFESKLNTLKSKRIHKLVTSEEFVKSKSSVIFEIGMHKVEVDIINEEFFHPLMRVASTNGKIALDIRNFFADILHNYEDYSAGKEFVSNSLYTSTENLQKSMKNCIDGPDEQIILLAEQFQRNVLGNLSI